MNAPIYSCLWFDANAHEAALFHCSLFPNSTILDETPMVTTYILNGTKFIGLNGGPAYKPGSAISYYVYCDGDAHINKLYAALSEGGKVLLPMNTYDWSPKYAWVIDRFGVNWQLDVKPIEGPQKIVPCILFVKDKYTLVKEAITFYTGLFSDSSIIMEAPYPSSPKMPQNTLLFAQFSLSGILFQAMSSTGVHDFDFTPGNSFVVECENQQEIDHLWAHLSAGGKEGQCGWLEDRFGVSWQIIPAILPQLMADPERSPRVAEAFMKMKKIDIMTLTKAWN